MQLELSVSPASERIVVEHGELLLIRNWLAPSKAESCFARLQQETKWQQSTIFIAGRPVRIPRLNAWYGEPEAHYRYSGRDFSPLPWTALLADLRDAVQETYDAQQGLPPQRFNSALLNLYRDGSDSVGWHADDEAELGPSPQIASLSLGASRRFLLKPRTGQAKRIELLLENGSLLLMLGDLQRHWLHSVPKTRQPVGPRINLTFRRVMARHEQ